MFAVRKKGISPLLLISCSVQRTVTIGIIIVLTIIIIITIIIVILVVTFA